tara:strand:+ start:90 stop:332 length:243 start_codon:yes stop_codon:yes gene_type:complete
MSLCDYKEIFGKVGEGVHSYRIFNIAVVDVMGTIIGAYFLQKYVFPQYDYIWVLLGLFILGIILHRLFCVETTVDKLLFN